jgi:hypothetical protein
MFYYLYIAFLLTLSTDNDLSHKKVQFSKKNNQKGLLFSQKNVHNAGPTYTQLNIILNYLC